MGRQPASGSMFPLMWLLRPPPHQTLPRADDSKIWAQTRSGSNLFCCHFKAATLPRKMLLGVGGGNAVAQSPGGDRPAVATIRTRTRAQPGEPESLHAIAEERSRKRSRDLLRDNEGVTPGVRLANRHSVKDACRSQGVLGEHIQFPNLWRQRV